jgi:hypothetical protein
VTQVGGGFRPGTEQAKKTRPYARHLKNFTENDIEETKFQGDNAQLLLRVNAKLPDGEKKPC